MLCAAVMALVAMPFACAGNSSARGLFVRGHGVPGADILGSHDVLRAGVLGDTGYSGPDQRGAAMAIYFMAMYMCGASFGPLLTGKLSDVFAHRAAALAGSATVTETFRATGLQQAMLIIPVLCIALALCFTWARALSSRTWRGGKLSLAGAS